MLFACSAFHVISILLICIIVWYILLSETFSFDVSRCSAI